ncbi:3-hydroxybutyryl-CoA dehydrogenase [Tuanshanicoccus lijuaniae]|uniref:3-hydroxybutyryl-CoA dehydrogenase n=1 Tax=Aerococcaceae bacterium zg-1292 TaxID=2774330 RepID=UPI0019384468|nr:3-hydroxybutyryl-CoA dehydrogenase [Aerococcaceae bacterium zg-1292]MBF6625802.1 3-hydroxybutyryl-CoA dehydrogenase [Aerococcaceae bacterium zg-BR9]MBF6978637.1 3-hydroxybutyryl-CoA dehydrogenase [Aerococcaceae bacterium zg-BR22]MBS4455622.1 3-hydroxybutyryl-CoA dehydrogenase [Aerococcaceae bacterium zg-A91]MBS4457241.1 3-hydroxybutyryl-CoA dehydrogenase [Aerococcaceae bacterium zg-BR33]
MEINKVLVIGSGQMGSGIAQVLAQAGYEVVLNDIKQEFVERGLNNITKQLTRLVEKGRVTEADKEQYLANITTSVSYDDAKDVDLVIEAATENREIKLNIFKQLSELVKEDAILATNTSSLSITEIATVTNRPHKVIGLHFFNPVPVMKLIELNIGLTTDRETVEAMKTLSERLGKTAIEVKDAPGFAVNRILIPMINEAIFVLSEGISTVEEIDEAMKLGANHPMGPLALADYIGLDTVQAIMNVLYDGYKDPKYRPCHLLRKYVEAGKLGRKSGAGFYNY